jgi:hypothetical protein
VKIKSLTEEATTLDKLKRAFSDVKSQQDANKSLAKTIQDMEIEREAVDKAKPKAEHCNNAHHAVLKRRTNPLSLA